MLTPYIGEIALYAFNFAPHNLGAVHGATVANPAERSALSGDQE